MNATAASPRIPPLEPPYEPELAGAARALDAARRDRSSRWHCSARSAAIEQLMSRMHPLGAGILGSRATVPLRLREVMIDRTCALAGAEYEWGVHATAFGEAAGLDEEQLRSTARGSHEDACWDPEQAAVMRLADRAARDERDLRSSCGSSSHPVSARSRSSS